MSFYFLEKLKMVATTETSLVISNSDYQRLVQLIEDNDSPAAEALDIEIGRATLVADAQLPADVVAMDSEVTFEDLDSGEQKTIQLVFPAQANVDQLKISILSPVGSALIGLRIGSSIDWPVPQGKVRRLKVIAVKQVN